jgi:hypothetical protein
MAWQIVPCSDYEKPKKEFTKKWPEEMRAVAANLRTLLLALENGAKSEQLKSLGFVHSEPMGILAIDERGCEKKTKPKAVRLYVFPDESESILYVMLLGDKSAQSKDIALCKSFAQEKLKNQQQKQEQ